MIKVFLGMPVYKYVEPETQDTLNLRVCKENDFYTISKFLILRGSANIYYQGYNLVLDFLKTDADYFLYFDADQVILEPDNFIEMMIKDDKDIISPIIVKKFYPHYPALLTFERKTLLREGTNTLEDLRIYPKDRPFEVYFPCGGIVLIKRKVLEAIDKPFMPVFNENGDLLSTDYSMYWKAKKKGFKCWVEPRIKAGHIGKFIFTIDDYHTLIDEGQIKYE